MGANLTDRDYIEIALGQHKLLADVLTTGILEASDDTLRQEMRTSLDMCLQHQKEIFDFMNQKGWYQPKAASSADVASTQSQYQNQNP